MEFSKAMKKLTQRSSTSFKHYSYLKMLLISVICLLFSKTSANGYFNPLIQLPTDGVYRNSSIMSTSRVVLNIDDFGAKGDGFTDDTKSLLDVWKVACSSLSKAKIVIPAGKLYSIRPVNFAGPCLSKVTLMSSVWDGLNIQRWLYFHGVKNLRVEGGGTINGMWWACKTNDSILVRMHQRLLLSTSART